MKLRGMNALFNLRVQITVGETMVVAVATATAMHLACLPSAPVLQFRRTQRVGATMHGCKAPVLMPFP
jgi:hypothetical protein